MNGDKKIALALAVMVMLTGISLYAVQDEDSQPSYSPEGAWLVNGVVAGQHYLWMDTYTSDWNKPGVSGTVLCTLPIASGSTQSGHGNWIRIGKNTLAFTAFRIQFSSNMLASGIAKFWGTVTVDAENETSGTMNIQYYDLNGNPVSPVIQGTSTGKRIEIELEGQQ